MNFNRVVIKYQDGTVKKGEIQNFNPTKTRFHLQLIEGGREYINMDNLKAIYFVKDYLGDKDYSDKYDEFIPGEGIKLGIEFKDGETLFGYCLGYSPKRYGFMLTPADSKCNNSRIYVIQSATERVVCGL